MWIGLTRIAGPRAGGDMQGRRSSGPTRRAPIVPICIFAVLLVGLCTAPALAFGAEPHGQGAESSDVPSPELFEAAMRRKEVEQNVAEERFEEELATPAAEQERQRSRTEFAHANASEASNLLDAEFGSVIEMLNEDPGRLLTRLKVEKMLGPYAARVSLPVTGREIVESGLPLVSALGDGDSMPVDLTLERSGGTFSPANPTSPTQLPATADGPIEVGDGVHVQMPASRDHEAVQVGQMSLFYPETETTTDTMLAPVAGGAEVFEQLRSAESPEELRFAVETPDGGHLTATPGGGAEILDSGGTGVEEVAPPTAIDAQGASVPTTMSVEGDSLVLDVELAATQPAYPVLVDPLFLEEPTSFGEWAFENVGAEYGHTWDASKLEVWSLGGGHLYPAETHGAFTYATPGETAWIEAATFRSISFFPNSCGGNQPHGYLGLYNPGAGRWEKLGVWEGLTPTGGDEWQTGWVGQPGTRWAVFGVGTNGIGASNTCVHEFYLGNYSLQEKDTTSPVITSVTGVPLDRWFDPETVGEASFAAADSGFGVFEISTGNGAAQPVGARPPGSGAGCTGVSGNRCPHEFTFQIKPAYERGKREFHVWAKDAMGNEATPFSGETWVDVERPAIELRGQFARATEEVGFSDQGAGNPADENKLRLPTYELQINATDGSNAEPGTMQSGVQGVEVLLDGKEQPLAWGTQKCPASESSCSLSGLYELQLPGLSAGVHELKAVATDRVGLSRERKIEFEYIPATGEGENQVLEHFPLPDGEAQDETGEEPTGAEVAVNVINGNLVFHQRDAEVASADAALPIQRTYNSELPQGQSSEFGSGWTLGDAPEIEGSGGGRATLVQGDGTMETAVMLPTQEGHQAFDPSTHAAIEKVPDGYAVIDEGESATPTADVAPTGLTNDLQGSAGATLDLEREGGELSELVADDPASASGKAEQSVTELPVGYMFEGSFGAPRPPDVEALSEPDATATDAEGDVWVADAGHDRVVEFDAEGGFVRQFGSTGTGPGEFSALHGIAAISGDVFVADADRIEEFDSTGGFVRQWSMESEGNTTEIVGVGIDPAGYLRVLDYPGDVGASMRMSTFTVEGALLQTVKTQAMAVLRPTGFAIDATGNIWVSDGIANRVAELSPSGFIQRVIGKEGSAPGQLFQPGGVAIDAAGHIWVADTGNDRLEEFSPAGAFLGRFGRPGGDEGLLSDPDGFSLSSSGVFWVADTGNDRLEKWVPSEPSPAPPAEPAPAASVETSDGLIESIEGDPTGILSYNHDGTQLTAVEGPGASTAYGYDPDGRLNLIELTHGTCVEVGYDAVGRVVKLTISVEGGLPEVTYFEYPVVPNEPVTRETVVRRPSKPATYYSISEEGSVLRWWYSATPPEIEEPTGSLWDQRGEVHSGTVTIGDQDLILNAASPHGIESILLVANGSGVVAERVCAEEHPWECSTLRLAYHTETGGWPPGVLSLEVVVKDAVGGASSLRFWDDIPYTPPPNDPELESPKYEEVLRFREEFGLDLDLKGNERAIEERIFNLIDAWHEPTPEGQVARASKERWGVPLRAIDVAELEYREWFYGVNAEKIDDWVEETQPGNFGGFYLAPQPGGIMYVGFLGNQEEELEHLKSSLSLVAQDRLRVYPVAPTVAYLAARAKTPSVTEAIESSQALRELVVDVREEEGGGGIQVGTPEVAKVARLLQEAVPGAPVNVVRESRGGRVLSGRFRNTGRMRAGDAIFNFIPGYGTEDCTAGFGAKERTGTLRGKATWALFTLTAGHCRESPAAPEFYRSTEVTPQPDKGTWSGIGTMSRDAWYAGGLVRTDAGAIETTESGLIPHGIFGERGELIPIRSAETAKIGGTLCYSGARTRVPSCGKVVARSVDWHNEAGSNEADRGGYWVRFTSPAQKGDSGAPVYDVFGHGVGMVTACRPVPDCSETLVEPLLHPLHMPADAVPGVLENPNLGQLSLAVGR